MKSLNLLLAGTVALFAAGGAWAAEYYVAPDGRPDNEGTMESPWDLEYVLGGGPEVEPGSTVYLKGGTYRHPDREWGAEGYEVSLKGTENAPIHIRPVQGERATIDGGLTVRGAEHVWIWELEITVSESADWDRRTNEAPASELDEPTGPAGGLAIHSATNCKFINLVVHNNNSTGVSFWRGAVDSELHGCLIFQNGYVGPQRPHGPGIYTQNETGEKFITDNILWGNYSTTIQAYGSERAYVDHFRIIGNIGFGPFHEGGRERFLIGGERPSRDIVVKENILYDVPLEIGYTAPHNHDCVVHDNIVVNAAMSINRYREVDEKNNLVIEADAARPSASFRTILRPNKYDPDRAHLAVYNWRKAPVAPVDLHEFLDEGERFRIMSALDFFGEPVVEGVYTGDPVEVPVPVEDATGGGEFCAFVVFKTDGGTAVF